MGLYEDLLAELSAAADKRYADFSSKLLKNENIRVMGVRLPLLRRMAKKYYPRLDGLMALPDEYFEVTFIKLVAISCLPYGEFIRRVDDCLPLLDNWSSCDSFKPLCIAKNRESFLPFIEAYIGVNKEFYQRFALVTLLNFYIDKQYLPLIFKEVLRADTRFYYVHMAAAWLIAETLVKYFDEGAAFLKSGALDIKTHNKAIQKARESYRLTPEQKNYLNGLKRKKS